MNLFYRDVKMVSIIIEGTFVNHDAIFLGQIEIDKESGLISRIGRTRALGTPDLVFGRGQLIFQGWWMSTCMLERMRQENKITKRLT